MDMIRPIDTKENVAPGTEEQVRRVEERREGMAPVVEPERGREVRTTAEVVVGGSMAEVLAGGGAVVLAIIGLAGLYPALLAEVATICVGAALLFKGAALAARFHGLVSEISGGSATRAELGTGVSTEFMAGATGVVLGILALLNVSSSVLLSVAAIVFGGALMLSSGSTVPLARINLHPRMHDTARAIARDAVYGAASAEVLVGAGAIVLGILALLGYAPLTLQLVTMLAVGGAIFLAGAAISGRMLSMLHTA